MGKKKLQRFAEMEGFSNTYQFPEGSAGSWHEKFGNENPIVLELACGRGEYTLALARMFPGKNVIGVDIKGARIWRGAKTAVEEKLHNAAFLRVYIEQIDQFFASGEVDEIWITFPDPHPPAGKAKKRLTSLRFLSLYTRFVKDGGIIHLKTDDRPLYDFTKEGVDALGLEILDNSTDVLSTHKDDPLLSVRTTYEKRWISEGKKINYLAFRLEREKMAYEKLKAANERVEMWLKNDDKEG